MKYKLKISSIIMILLLSLVAGIKPAKAVESVDYNDYVSILYNSENGMPTSEANDIDQTSDGFIWIASYSGLIRYDGNDFERQSSVNGVSSANTLFIDSKDQLWIGSNDNGVMTYINGEYHIYNTKDGLLSNSVRNIVENNDGQIYVGTTSGVSLINPKTNKIINLDNTVLGNEYIKSMVIDNKGVIVCVTSTNKIYTIKDKEVKEFTLPEQYTETIVSVYCDNESGTVFFGSEKNSIYKCDGEYDNYTCTRIDAGTLININELYYSKDRTLWICADNGIGYFSDGSNSIQMLKNFPLDNSIDSVMQDYEGNMWFTSSRQGVVKATRNYFVDISAKAGLSDLVVNSNVSYNGETYIAHDEGLVVLNNNQVVTNELTNYLNKVRIRCLLVDDSNRLWLCTYGSKGLVCYDGKSITSISSRDGIDSSKVRSVIQGNDGIIYAATANGVYLIKDFKVVGHIGSDEGLTNNEVLSMYQSEDNTLYLGTDGGGVCIAKDGKISDVINNEDGLKSDIVMKIRYDATNKGYWLITSSAISFYDGKKVKNIDNFPYSNNLDLYFGQNDNIWVLSSNGIYVVTGKDMLNNKVISYTFYDHNSGMPSTPTSNSFSYQKDQMLYICGNKGVFSISMDNQEQDNIKTKLAIPNLVVDGEKIYIKDDEVHIDSDAKRISIDAYALSYNFQNPEIEYYLEGFDDEKINVRKSTFGEVVYTNLSGGDYTFHIDIIDSKTSKTITSHSVKIIKEKHFSETLAFPVFIILGILLIIFIVYKFRLNRVVLQKEEEQKEVLQDALDMAKNASNAKGQFLSKMSHEMRTPLNAVIGYMDIAKESADSPEKVMHCIENSDIAAKHLLNIINDVLDMSSIESGKLKISNEDFDLKKLITSLTTIFYNQAKAKGINFGVKIEDLNQEWVIGDSLRLNQILMNLLSNAMKFTNSKGSVSLNIKQMNINSNKVYIRFIVSDTGIGMSEEYLSRIFTPFEQEDASTAKRFGGTGLGLSISHNLVNMMGGNIQVDSKEGVGTTFTVTMSFDLSYKNNMIRKTNDFSNLRVLIVDDDKSSLEYIKSLFKRCNIKSDVVDSGEKAVKQIKRRMDSDYKYDLCVIDWRMPEIDGIETARRIKEICDKQMPIIIATAFDISEFKEEAKEAGIDKIVSKPLFQSTVFDLLVSTFGQYEPQSEVEVGNIDLSGIRILLAEDNDMNMEIAVRLLERYGMIVESAYNGQEVYEMFTKSEPGYYDAILMDVQMPIMNGYEATSKIRNSTHPNANVIPIIAMTANAFREDVADALASGMNDHISKPVQYDKVLKSLHKFIKK